MSQSHSELKAELLDVDTNFHDHVEARQRMIKELTQRADELAHAKEQWVYSQFILSAPCVVRHLISCMHHGCIC